MTTKFAARCPTNNAAIRISERSNRALTLDPSLDESVPDVTHEEAARWVVAVIAHVDLDDPGQISRTIGASRRLLADEVAAARWPVSAHAHLQVVHQLGHCLIEHAAPADAGAEAAAAQRWAEDEIIKLDLSDPHEIADHMGEVAAELGAEAPGGAKSLALTRLLADLKAAYDRCPKSLH